ncbi:MAG: threonine dehydratase [Alphaproteobacteria bacterium]|nr:threonine dehydratase [Alphaproteobacteria bacterium]
MFTLAELEAASAVVRRAMPPTPQYAWPLLAAAAGCEVWVKHENHSPIGAFKVRGGLVLIDELQRAAAPPRGLVSATRGNHGQSLAFAAQRAGMRATIFVPHGNSVEKNAAMRAFGAELVEHGEDFDAARVAAEAFAQANERAWVASFHPALVRGVATYALELFSAVAGLDTVYAPIGMGSGICGLIRVRDLLGLATEIVGVVSAHAPAVALSFAARRVVTTERAATLADGMACRVPDRTALATILDGASRIVQVTDAEVGAAIRLMHEATHNTAEGAGAAALAALLQERGRQRGRRVGIVLSGGNIDRAVLAPILAA